MSNELIWALGGGAAGIVITLIAEMILEFIKSRRERKRNRAYCRLIMLNIVTNILKAGEDVRAGKGINDIRYFNLIQREIDDYYDNRIITLKLTQKLRFNFLTCICNIYYLNQNIIYHLQHPPGDIVTKARKDAETNESLRKMISISKEAHRITRELK